MRRNFVQKIIPKFSVRIFLV